MRFQKLSAVVLAAALVAAATPDFSAAQNVRQSGRSNTGMVSAAHPMATEAGVKILEMGGNAADAAVAAGFAIAVVEPTMNSIGGRNQILLRTAEGEFTASMGRRRRRLTTTTRPPPRPATDMP